MLEMKGAEVMQDMMVLLHTALAIITLDVMDATICIRPCLTVTRHFPSLNHISSLLDILLEAGFDNRETPVGPQTTALSTIKGQETCIVMIMMQRVPTMSVRHLLAHHECPGAATVVVDQTVLASARWNICNSGGVAIFHDMVFVL